MLPVELLSWAHGISRISNMHVEHEWHVKVNCCYNCANRKLKRTRACIKRYVPDIILLHTLTGIGGTWELLLYLKEMGLSNDPHINDISMNISE